MSNSPCGDGLWPHSPKEANHAESGEDDRGHHVGADSDAVKEIAQFNLTFTFLFGLSLTEDSHENTKQCELFKLIPLKFEPSE